MYTDPEEARSDLFLAGAVYLFGPLLLRLTDRLAGVGVIGDVYIVIVPLLTTALVPLLLIRYRKEPASAYGLRGDRAGAAQVGLLLGLPVVVAAAATSLADGGPPMDVLAGAREGEISIVALLANATTWIGLVILAAYATVKSRDAFRSELQSVRAGVIEVGRVLGIAGGVAALLLFATRFREIGVLLLPLGFAAAGYLLLRGLSGPSTATRMTFVAPVVLLVLGPLNPLAVLFDPAGFVVGVWVAAMVGATALLVAGLLESRRTAYGALALALLFAVFVRTSFLGG